MTFLPPGYEISRLKIVEQPAGAWKEPLLYAEHIAVRPLWRELLRGHLVGRVRVVEPKVLVVRRPERKAEKAKDISTRLAEAAPLRVDRLEIVDGEAPIAQRGPKGPRLWIHDLDLVATNLSTRKALSEGAPARLRADAEVQRSGKMKLDFTMDPFAKGLTFAGKAALTGLDARELHAFVAEEGVRITKGQINVYADIRAEGGRLSGGVKPVELPLQNRTLQLARLISLYSMGDSIFKPLWERTRL